MSDYPELRHQLLKWAREYYIDNNPSVSDEEYDTLFRKVKAIENSMGVEGITSQVRCGLQTDNSFAKVRHDPPMLSLDNVFTEEEYQNWIPDSDPELIGTPKLDGASLTLTYKYGILSLGARRGDGKVGDDITPTVANIAGIPQTVDILDPVLQVRGEVVCPTFDTNFADAYKNQRNFVSGSLNLKDAKEVKKRELVFYAYMLIQPLDPDAKYHVMLNSLSCMGFNTVSDIGMWTGKASEFDFQEALKKTYTLKTDGIVLAVNDLYLAHNLGRTSHHPRGMVAVKPKAEVKETTLLHVDFQVGKTGNITPVAILDPIELDDTTVSRCTLHNFNEIRKLDVAINDTVKVMKSGFIIPKIIDVVKRPTNRIPIKISNCVSCKSKLVTEGAYLKCVNPECSATAVQQLLKFVQSGKFMGFGKATIEKLKDAGVGSISDLLNCDFDFFEKVLDSGKIAEKLAEQITFRPKEMTYVEALAAINLPLVNESTAEKLLNAGLSDVFMLRDQEKLLEVPGIGPQKAEKISRFVRDNAEELGKLSKILPLKVTAKDIVQTDSLVNVAITGKVSLSRTKAKEVLKKLGYTLNNSVTKKTQILIVGDKPGADKILKAKNLGISIVQYTNSDFHSLI